MSTTKRAWKLQEFVAHSGNVNCLSLGHRSGRVMVTGGEDKKVNLWTVGKPNCIMSLSGHTSPVEAVRFGNAEEMVVAGSMSGALKIWDLEAAKIVRTLTGHKASIRSLEFHPFGEYVASGSLDTNIKLWDIRRKGCIFTYKGHTNGVNCLRFSPDGRWMVSAGEDGHLKMWDLTAGKLLADFKDHSGAVTTCEFHPDEFLLASGSSDRTVKFWDLDSFNLISSTDGDSTPVRSIFFHQEGLCLYSGASDHLKVYGWEPVQCYDSVSLGWGKVCDIALAQNQLIGATYSATNVSTFVVDIQRCGPVAKVPNSPVFSPPATPSGRRSFTSQRPQTQSSKRSSQVAEAPEEAITPSDELPDDDSTSLAEIKDPHDYEEVFKPRSKIGYDEPKPLQAPDEDFMPKPVQVQHKPAGRSNSGSNLQRAPVASASSSTAQQRTPVTKPSSPPAKVAPSSSSNNRPPPTQSSSNRGAPSGPTRAIPAPTPAPQPAYGDCNIDDFLPKKSVPQLGEDGQVPANMSDADAFSSITKGHGSMQAVLTARQRNLQIVRAMWTAGNKTAIESAIGMHDQAVIVDLLNVFNQKPGLWSLDLCTTLLPQVKDLMGSKYDNYVLTGCAALKAILRNFASVIKLNLDVPSSIGVDISREERHHKCKSCYDVLMAIRSSLEQKGRPTGKLGSKYREIQVLFNQLD